MLTFQAEFQKFDKKGEKTGWTYIDVTAEQIKKLNPGTKKSFRVKGKIDTFKFAGVALIPMGEGDFILPINAEMRKGTKKQKGDTAIFQLSIDKEEYKLNEELVACLKEDKKAKTNFDKLPRSHQNYYSKWIDSAKTIETKSKRIAQCLFAFANNMDYGEMLRHFRDQKL